MASMKLGKSGFNTFQELARGIRQEQLWPRAESSVRALLETRRDSCRDHIHLRNLDLNRIRTALGSQVLDKG